MLKDITLGQFFPGDTIAHRLDPRTKLLMVTLDVYKRQALTQAGTAQTAESSSVPAAEPAQPAYEQMPTERYSMVGDVLETVGENDEVAGMTQLLSYCYAYRLSLIHISPPSRVVDDIY